ncbi:hypothetical protein K469DRAFT_755922 [Zopfia rhizophila CBS 207.26]|uniref:BHLH domain-containing protein n=1 Tax=Zopfia rhizophila CBS 207.26 TaxID=1314779 RepID=A0A6A6DDI5_9PEZI|nr:hypothetical protein K469DRAFT_755922 [Zopfia rhizophila CBS 207.26]
MDARTRAFLEQQYQLKCVYLATLTALVSPVVVPNHSGVQLPTNFITSPGAQYSPLNPTLTYHGHSTVTNSSSAEIATDEDVYMIEESGALQSASVRPKGYSINIPRPTGAATRPIQPPTFEPNPRESDLATPLLSKDVKELLQRIEQTKDSLSHNLPIFGSHHNSCSSKSRCITSCPECRISPLSKSASALQSSKMTAGHNGVISERQGVWPATPASLVRSNEQPQSISDVTTPSNSLSLSQNGMILIPENPPLAEAASSQRRPSPARRGTAVQAQSKDTPPCNSLRKSRAHGRPSISPGPLALSAKATFPSTARMDPRRHGVRKRSDANGAPHVRSLLRTTSPRIKPLLPEEGVYLERSCQKLSDPAILLESKSNYQHFIEGTRVPGVKYPEGLYEKLNSKRTSHKVAEQARRNRMNVALGELGRLLPTTDGMGTNSSGSEIPGRMGCANSPKGKANEINGEKVVDGAGCGGARDSDSKAKIVESAIDYIKQLQRDVLEWEQSFEKGKGEIEVLRRLRDAEGGVN